MAYKTFLLLATTLSIPSAAAVSGMVTNRAGNGIAGIEISLVGAAGTSLTDSKGAWSLATTSTVHPKAAKALVRGGNELDLSLSAPANVRVEGVDVRGNQPILIPSMHLQAGLHALHLPISKANLVWLRVTINGQPQQVLRSTGDLGWHTIDAGIAAYRTYSILDTLRFTLNSRVVALVPLGKQDTSGIVARIDTGTTSWNSSVLFGLLYDSRDGQVYRTTKIGSQTWMSENLNYSGTGTTGACYDHRSYYCDAYGRLYSWAEALNGGAPSASVPSGARGICPVGWHVPSKGEWTNLQLLVDSTNRSSGTQLKSSIGWSGTNNGLDSFGFRATPGGQYTDGSSFNVSNIGYDGNWWSSTQNATNEAWYVAMGDNDPQVFIIFGYKSNGYSLRCTKD